MDKEAAWLQAQLLEWIQVAPAGFSAGGASRAARYALDDVAAARLDAQFESLALALFEYQYAHVPVYRAWCESLGRTPHTVSRSIDVPALPVDAFKQVRVASFPPSATVASFRTSGTTQSDAGVLALESLALYDLALERSFAHHVLPDCDSIRMLILVASSQEAPESSLSYMMERVKRRWGAPESTVLWRNGQPQWRELRQALESACSESIPVCLLGTAFGWVQVLDVCEAEGIRVRLPAGSRVFETGGYKGRTRSLSRAELYSRMEQYWGIPISHVVAEYGMTELGSQYYTLGLRRALRGEAPGDDAWSAPAWLRPRLLDAETNTAVECDRAASLGLLVHHDLANLGSVAHLLTADLGRPSGPSFELEGRCPNAELRGCGLVHEASGA